MIILTYNLNFFVKSYCISEKIMIILTYNLNFFCEIILHFGKDYGNINLFDNLDFVENYMKG